MADGFSISVDAEELLAMMDRVGPSLDFHCRDVARLTAIKIADEAAARLRRATSGQSTGVTASEVHWEMTRDGKGYVVLGYREGVGEDPIDIYLEYGTEAAYARPWFWGAALLENGPHLRRMEERVQQVIEDLGR